MAEVITFSCPCSQGFDAEPQEAGKVFECPLCAKLLRVPGQSGDPPLIVPALDPATELATAWRVRGNHEPFRLTFAPGAVLKMIGTLPVKLLKLLLIRPFLYYLRELCPLPPGWVADVKEIVGPVRDEHRRFRLALALGAVLKVMGLLSAYVTIMLLIWQFFAPERPPAKPPSHEQTARPAEQTRDVPMKQPNDLPVDQFKEWLGLELMPADRPGLRRSPLDRLDRAHIPPEERCAGQPQELVAVLGTQRGRHWSTRAGTVCLALCPDGKTVVSGWTDNTVRLWDATTLCELAMLKGRGGCINAVAFSPDGKVLAAVGGIPVQGGSFVSMPSGASGWLQVWEISEEGLGALFEDQWAKRVYAVAFSPDGNLLAAGGRHAPDEVGNRNRDGWVQVWDLSDGTPKELSSRNKREKAVHSVAFSPDGRFLAAGGEDQTILVWDLHEESMERASQKRRWLLSVLLAVPLLITLTWKMGQRSPGEAEAAVVGSTAGDCRKTRLRALLLRSAPVAFYALLIAQLYSMGTWVWHWWYRPGLSTPWATLEGHTGAVNTLAFAPDSKVLASGSSDKTVRLWKLDSSTPERGATLEGHRARVSTLAFSPDGTTLASGSDDNSVKLWDVRTGKGGSFDGRLQFSQDCKLLVSHANKALWLWDLSGARPLPPGKLQEFAGGAWSVAFAPDGRTLAIVGNPADRDTTTVGVWRLDSVPPQLLGKIEERGRFVTRPQYSPDGMTLATSGGPDKRVRLWDLTGETFKPKAVLEGHTDEVRSLAFSPDGRTLAAAGADRTVHLWDLTKHPPQRSATFDGGGTVWGMVFTPDAGRVAVFTQLGAANNAAPSPDAVALWDVKDNPPKKIEVPGKFRTIPTSTWKAVLIDRVQHSLALAWDRGRQEITVWEMAGDPRLLRTLQWPGFTPDVRLAPDGRHLITTNNNGTVSILRLWEFNELDVQLAGSDDTLRRSPGNVKALLQRARLYLQQLELKKAGRYLEPKVHHFTGHTQGVSGVAFLSGGHRALTATAEDALRLWDLDTGQERRITVAEKGIRGIAVTGDGRHVLTVHDDHLRLWDLDTGKEVRKFEKPQAAITCVALSADGTRGLSGHGDGTIRFWDIAAGKELRARKAHAGGVGGVALTPDGTRGVSGDADGMLRLWDLAKGKELWARKGPVKGVRQFVFAADGRRFLFGGSDGGVRLWDTATGQELRCMQGHEQAVATVALFADGKLALSGGQEGTLRVWDLTTGQELGVFQKMGSAVTSVALSPDGRLALSSSGNDVRLWRLPLTWHQAIADLTLAIKLEPRSVTAHVLRSRCFLSREHLKEALADVSQVLKLDAKCRDAYALRAAIYSQQKEHDKAIADLTELVTLAPNHALAFYQRGLAHAAKEDYARARADLERAIKLDPSLAPE
jgi:WD40 repeat protein